VPVWNPHLKGDIEELENIQQRATRLVPGLKKVEYIERLRKLRLKTLETRRKRGDFVVLQNRVWS
jgi:ribonuclease P/MRP protein subunit RPP40